MALGTPVLTANGVIQVGTTSNPTTTVGGLLTWTYTENTPTTERRYIGQATATAVGKSGRTITFSCDYEAADDGQTILHAAAVSKVTIWARILPDAVKGEIVAVKVSNREISAPDADGYHTVNFTLNQQADPVAVGGGFG